MQRISTIKGLKFFICTLTLLTIFTCLQFSNSAIAAAEAKFYVAPNGSSGSSCSLTDPCTLEGARDKARTLLANMNGDIDIYLRGGTYNLSSTFTLTGEDSGQNGHYVNYKAYSGEKPILSGGTVINGWQLYDADQNIYRAPVDIALETRQLFVNGKRAQRAREAAWPISMLNATGHTTTDLSMQNWQHLDQVEFVYRYHWSESRCSIATVLNGVITMKPTCWPKVTSITGIPDWIENAYELLDEPGEWYLNTSDHYVYYKPLSGENLTTAEVIAPKLETLVQGAGTLDLPIRNLSFSGLTFEYATWLQPSGPYGVSQSQANLFYPTDFEAQLPEDLVKIHAAVSLHTAYSVLFERNVFIHLGAGGLNIDIGQNNRIQGNVFRDISGNGLMLGDVKREDHHPTDPRRYVKDNQILNNVVSEVGQEFHGGVGIFVGYTENTLISHNEVFNVPYTGISIGWGWGSPEVDEPGNPSASKDNKIIANYVHDHMLEMNDGGGIYSLGAQRNMLIKANVVHGQTKDQGAYYLDNGSRYVTMENNIAYNNKHNMLANGSEHLIRDNYWDNESNNKNISANSILTNNHILPVGSYPLTILNQAGLTMEYADLLETQTAANIAADKIAYAYDASGNVIVGTDNAAAERATDQDLTTSVGPGAMKSLMVDLGRSYALDAIILTFPLGKVPSLYKLEIADWEGHWETVVNEAVGHSGRNLFPLGSKQVRDVKVTAITGDMAVAEVEAYRSGTQVPMNSGFSVNVISPEPALSSSTALVNVNGDNTLTGTGVGTAVISAANNDWQFNVSVELFDTIELTAEKTNVAVGRSTNVNLAGVSMEGLKIPYDLNEVVFNSSVPSIIDVDENGLATAYSAGQVTITATTEQGGLTTKQIVLSAFEEQIEEVQAGMVPIYLHSNESGQIQINGLLFDSGYTIANEDIEAIQYSSLDTSIADVDAQGLVMAKRPGRTVVNVTVIVAGVEASTEVDVLVYPSDWQYADINGATGTAAYDNGHWSIRNKGSDIFGNVDKFGLVYKEIDLADYPNGLSVTTTIYSLDNVHGSTMTGLMLRKSLDPGSPHVNYRIHASGDLVEKYMPFVWRLTEQGATDYFYSTNLALPVQMRLTYTDKTIVGQYWDEASLQWIQAGAMHLDLGTHFLVGVAHTSHEPEIFSNTNVSDIEISAATGMPIRITAETNLLQVNEVLQLDTTGNGADETIRYSSSNEAVATVDEAGTVIAHALGAATIRAAAFVNDVEQLQRADAMDVIVYDNLANLSRVNAALNKPAAAMSLNLQSNLATHTGAPAAFGNDGNLNTGTQVTGQYDWAYRVDLGNLQSLSGMSVIFAEGSYATDFEFLVSKDGIDWELIKSFSNGKGGILYNENLAGFKMVRYMAVKALRPNAPSQEGTQMNVAEFAAYAYALPIQVSGVSLNKPELTLVLGGVGSLLATVSPVNATNKQVIWSSSNTEVATVDQSGQIFAHQLGTATITAVLSDNASLSATSIIKVKAAADMVITNVALNKPAKGLTTDLQSDAVPGTPFNLGNDGILDTYSVPTGIWGWAYQVDLEAIKSLSGMAVTFHPGGYATEFEFLISTNGTDWEVADTFSGTTGVDYIQYRTDFAEVKAARYAVVKAISPNGPGQTGGQMVISEFEVYGYTPSVSEVSLNRAALSIGEGGTYSFVVNVAPIDAANKNVTWASSDAAIAIVDAAGKVTAHQQGTAVITATAADDTGISASSMVTVKAITNVALNQPAKGLTTDLQTDAVPGTPFNLGNDGILDTYSVPTGIWGWAYQVDLEAIKSLSGMAVTFHPGGYATEFEFLISTNGTDWEVADTFSGTTGANYIQYRSDFADVKSARYAAVRAISPNGPGQTGGQMVISEFEVYEYTVLPLAEPTLQADITALTNTNVSLTISYPTEAVVKEYRVGENGIWTAYTAPVGVSENETVYARGANASGTLSNVSHIVISNIDKVSPTATVAYSAVATESVIATMTSSEPVTITNNGGLSSYSFIFNGSFTFEFVDAAGNQGTATAIVNDIVSQSKTKPGTPILSDDNGYDFGLQDGDYNIAMNMWYGDNGRIYKLYENDILLDTKLLIDHSPNAQVTTTAISGRKNGAYIYRAEITNAFGTTTSSTHTVTVTNAAPAKPVLSNDNWDGDGSFRVSMNMWWGTNATTYNLYENGVLIYTQALTNSSPAAQTAVTNVANKVKGTYEYRGELVNNADATSSDLMTVSVTK